MTKLKDTILSKTPLQNLSIILSNIKIGKRHLQKHLSPSQIKYLQKIVKSKNTKELKTDLEEKSGDILRRFVTISTGIIGALMGINDLLYHGNSTLWQLILMTIITIVIGFFIGFFSYKSMTKQAKEICFNQDNLELQIIILDEMIIRQKNKIRNLKNKLNQLLGKMGLDPKIIKILKSFYSGKATEKIKKTFLSQSDEILKKEWIKTFGAREKFPSYLHYKFSNIKKIMSNTNPTEILHKQDHADKNDLISILSTATLKTPQTSLKFSSWLLSQRGSILNDIIPVLIGTFSGLFVFLTGVPAILKKTNFKNSLNLLGQPYFKYLLLLIAVIFTAYLVISQGKVIYKSWLRAKTVEKTQIKVNERELEYREFTKRATNLRKTYDYWRDISEYVMLKKSKPVFKEKK